MQLAILSDIHEDLSRLRRVLKKIDQKGCDLTVCLGDISGFSEPFYRYRKSRNASACLELVRRKCDIIIPGNHDLHAAGKIPEPSTSVKDERWDHHKDLDPGFSEEEIAFLSALPSFRILPGHGKGILLSHYASPNISGIVKGFYTRGSEFASHFRFMQEKGCALGFTGHAHARGFYTVGLQGVRHYSYRRLLLKDFPLIIGIPPVTRHKYRTGFCIFDTNSSLLQVFKQY
ncbi:MAG: metallophosphoesterase [Bacteroidales bacterium]|nr:metallophosphoesterase [Bacteroidales bacterium]